MLTVMKSFVLYAALVAMFFGLPTWSRKQRWKSVECPLPSTRVHVRFFLYQRNLDVLENLVYRISDPNQVEYGQYLNVNQVRDLIQPEESNVQKVMGWAHRQGARNVELAATRDSIRVEWSIGEIQDIFGITMDLFTADVKNIKHLLYRTEESVTMPLEIAPLIEYTLGLHDFPAPFRYRSSFSGAFKGKGVTPDIIYETYGMSRTAGLDKGPLTTSQAVAEFEEAYFYPQDIATFQKKNNLPIDQPKLIGPNSPNEGYLGEATLDIEFIMASAPRVPTWVFSLNGYDLVGWADTVMKTKGAPLVHSLSWGSPELDHEHEFVMRSNTEFTKLAAMGYSVLVASGDDGTGNSGNFWCDRFQATFPASSPYVTSVGGTYLDPDTNQEIGWSSSGGGFSEIFSRPIYQEHQVDEYLERKDLPPDNVFMKTGRGIPDISALSTNFQVLIQNFTGPMSGTSAATPVFAAIIARLNQVRSDAGLPPLGFLNPWLYSLPSTAFHDIVSGNNRVIPCLHGFSAAPGWDAICGLGTPNFPILSDQAKISHSPLPSIQLE